MKKLKQRQKFLDDLRIHEIKNNQVPADENYDQEEGMSKDGSVYNRKRAVTRSLLVKREVSNIKTKVSAEYYYYKHLFGFANEESDDEEYGEDY